MLNTRCHSLWHSFVRMCLSKLMSLLSHFRTAELCLLCVTQSHHRPCFLVITCLGPPLPAAWDDLAEKVEIKCACEVSPFQRQPPLFQLPDSPLSYLSGLWNSQNQGKYLGECAQNFFFFPSASNRNCGRYKNRNCHKCINHLTLCDSNQLGSRLYGAQSIPQVQAVEGA